LSKSASPPASSCRDGAIVEKLDVFAQVEVFVRLLDEFEVPIVVVAEEDAGIGHHLGILQRRPETFDLLADFLDLLIGAILPAAVVSQDAAVEFLRANPRLAPEKIKHAGGTARDELVGEHPHDAGPHERVHVLPVDRTGLLFDDPEARVAVGCFDARLLERTHHVDFAGHFG
jgi:hypothetical protein